MFILYKLFSTILIIIIFILTIVLSFIQPKMHKNILIYSSEYEVVENNTKTTTIKKEQPVKTIVKDTKKKTIEKKTQKVKKNNSQKTNIKKQNNKQTKTKEITVIKTEKKEIPKPQIIKTEETNEIKEEEILWNKWRSDLQNQIMKDVKMPIIQEGVIFKFSFDVDKYGKITNIKTYSPDAMYTPYAIQYIAPVIKSYQGRDIIRFPNGSNRFETKVEGGWKISKTLKYSSPSDFKDKEVIKK